MNRVEIQKLDRECSLLSTELLLKCGNQSSHKAAPRQPSSSLVLYAMLGIGFCLCVKLGLSRPSLQNISMSG